MIITRIPRRPTGKSSFKKLHSYLSEVMDPDTGELRERGEMFLSPAVMSAETAAKEMWAVAAENTRVKDPVEHLVITWQESEQPDSEQWQEAVGETLESLGWKDHQWLAVAHTDTDNFHVHIEVNKVHPETFRSHTPDWMHKTLAKSAREIEAKQGWREDNGLYKWDPEKRQAVPVPRDELERRKEASEATKVQEGAAGTGKAAKMEQFADTESLETYAKGEPAKALDQVMKREGATWQDVHAALAKHGLELKKGERGGFTVRTTGNDSDQVHAKASKVFRKHFAGKAQREATETKLGDWQPPAAYVAQVTKTEQHYSPHRETRQAMKRDPEKRQQQREQRARERADLKFRFNGYKGSFYSDQREARKADADLAREGFRKLSAEATAKRRAIRDANMPAGIRKAALSVAAVESLQARERLREQLAAERKAKRTRALNYRDWVVVQASQSDKAAERQLRGWAYQDRRKAAQAAKMPLPDVQAKGDQEKAPQDRPQRPVADPVAIQRAVASDRPAVVLRMSWQANERAGTVDYYVNGKQAFTDQGSRLTFAKHRSEQDEIEAGLRVSVQKFGKEVNVRGSEEFKRQAIEVAVVRGIDLKFSDPAMSATYDKLKAARAAELAQKARTGQTPPEAVTKAAAVRQDTYRDVRDLSAELGTAVAKNDPELAKALALDRAALAASEKLSPADREEFMRTARDRIERDLAAEKPLPDVRKDVPAHEQQHEQDRDDKEASL